MNNPNFFLICRNAFITVIRLLSLSVMVLSGLIKRLPQPASQAEHALPTEPAPQTTHPLVADPAVAVAIASAVNAVIPGARVTRIEEIR